MLPVGFLIAISFVLGIALDGSGYALPLAVAVAGGFAIFTVLLDDWRWIVLGCLSIAAIILGTLRIPDTASSLTVLDLSEHDTFQGRVDTVPRHYPGVSYAAIELREPEPARIWGELPPYPRIRQGDLVRLYGDFQSLEDGNARGWSAQTNIGGIVAARSVWIDGNVGSRPQRLRNSIADGVRQRLEARIPEPAGAFTVGMLLGDDGAMTEATRDAFRIGGLSHLTAVSGFHIGIVAGGILLLNRAGLVHRWLLLLVAVALIWGFAYVVGMRPSVVRASLMLTLFLIAEMLGRPRATLNAVALATALMLFINPVYRYDVGFQLSVAATLGIALSLPLIANRSIWHTVWVVPLSAEVAVEPLILYHFGYYSLVSPLANILASPFVAATMSLGVLTVLVSLVNGFVADVTALTTWVPARAVVAIADRAAQVPMLSGMIEPISLQSVWVSYVVLAGLVAIFYVYLHPRFDDRDGDAGSLYRI